MIGKRYIDCRRQPELAFSCRSGASSIILGLRRHAKEVLETIAQVVGDRLGNLFASLCLELIEVARLGRASRYGNGCNLLVNHISRVNIEIARAGKVGTEFRVGIAIEQRHTHCWPTAGAFTTGFEADTVFQRLFGQREHIHVTADGQVDAIGNHGTGRNITHGHAETKAHGFECITATIDAIFCGGGNRKAVIAMRRNGQILTNIKGCTSMDCDLSQTRYLAVGGIESKRNFLAKNRNAPG